MSKITLQQMLTAYTYAHSYRHFWADALNTDYNGLRNHFTGAETPEEFNGRLADLLDHPESTNEMGILCPYFEEFEGETCVSHRTGSGRLEWWISPSSKVTVLVHRPGLSAPVIRAEYIHGDLRKTLVVRFPEYEATGEHKIKYRHLEALAEFMNKDYIPGPLEALHRAMAAAENIDQLMEDRTLLKGESILRARIVALAIEDLIKSEFTVAYTATKKVEYVNGQMGVRYPQEPADPKANVVVVNMSSVRIKLSDSTHWTPWIIRPGEVRFAHHHEDGHMEHADPGDGYHRWWDGDINEPDGKTLYVFDPDRVPDGLLGRPDIWVTDEIETDDRGVVTAHGIKKI